MSFEKEIEVEYLEGLIEELNTWLLKADKEQKEVGSQVAMELFKGIDYLNKELGKGEN